MSAVHDDGELVVERIAALDLGKAALEVCVRVPHEQRAGRRLQEVRGYATTRRCDRRLSCLRCPGRQLRTRRHRVKASCSSGLCACSPGIATGSHSQSYVHRGRDWRVLRAHSPADLVSPTGAEVGLSAATSSCGLSTDVACGGCSSPSGGGCSAVVTLVFPSPRCFMVSATRVHGAGNRTASRAPP